MPIKLKKYLMVIITVNQIQIVDILCENVHYDAILL